MRELGEGGGGCAWGGSVVRWVIEGRGAHLASRHSCGGQTSKGETDVAESGVDRYGDCCGAVDVIGWGGRRVRGWGA